MCSASASKNTVSYEATAGLSKQNKAETCNMNKDKLITDKNMHEGMLEARSFDNTTSVSDKF